jgi:N-acetylmuramoyl-L-alanine amidase
MRSTHPRHLHWLPTLLAVVVLAAISLMFTGYSGAPEAELAVSTATVVPTIPPTPVPPTAPPTPAPTPLPPPPTPHNDLSTIGAITTRAITAVRQAPNDASPVVSRLRAGITLPAWASAGPFVRVLTPCEVEGWVRVDETEIHPRTTGRPASFEQSVFVIDPGHGGQQAGARGPAGLAEKDANLAIAHRLVGRLQGAQVYLTRDADYTAGLRYRAALANALGAHALVSIHNNSAPDGPSDHPGTETWHQSRSTSSLRLAQAVQNELVEALRSFDVSWVADHKAGTRTRLNKDGHDFYGLLRGSRVPTVIVEAMFISNGPEEDLLRRPEGQDAVAGALSRSLRRFASDPEPDVGARYIGAVGTAGGVPAGCVDPA